MIIKYIKYKATWSRYSGGDIETVPCLRETDHFVIYKLDGAFEYERKAAKMSDSQSYFDSWEEAHSWLLNRAEGLRGNVGRELQRADRILASIIHMVKPEGGE